MENIITNESGFRPDAINSTSGAAGLGQALPASKMGGCSLDFKGVECQIEWIIKYITNRYGTPLKAWEFWQEKHWY